MASSLASHSGHKRQKPSNDVDRLSKLPDSVLCYILSLVPTKDALATSLLSKRWKFLWTNTRNLIFSDIGRVSSHGKKLQRNIKFAHFVNRVLIFLNGQSIHRFSLKIEESCEVYDLTTWIATAVARKLKVLQFCLNTRYTSNTCIQLPCSLFTCKTLEVLVLVGVMSLNVPSLVCLTNLKILHLESVNYQCDESVHNLISGCSSLQILYIVRNVYDNVITFTISSPTLRSLTFKFQQGENPFPEELDYKLEINAPALRFLDLCDFMSRDFSVQNLCSLYKANIQTRTIIDETNVDFYIDEPLIDYDEYSKAVAQLLQGVYNVKHLSLSCATVEALSRAGASPSFLRLTRLTAEAECCHWNSLLNLVKGSNKLGFLTFSKNYGHEGTHLTCWSKPEKVPICLLSCLKTMSVGGFEGLDDELAMVGYILKNAKVLRTMTIKAAYPLDIEARFQLLQKVSKFARGSEECEITFS